MLTAEQNELLTRIGPGTPCGELMRRYWHPIAAASELEGQVEQARPPARRGPGAVQGQAGPARPDHRAMPAPPRLARLRHPDQRRHPLPLSRLGVRPQRRNASSSRTSRRRASSAQGQDTGLFGRGAGRRDLGLSGPGRKQAAAAAHRRLRRRRHDPHARPLLVPCNWLQIMENSLDPVHTEWLHGHTYEFIKEQKGQGHKVAISAHHEKIAFREFEHGITKHRLLAGHSEDCDDWKVGHPIVFPNILSVGAGDETTRATTRSRSACRWTTRHTCISGTPPTCRRRPQGAAASARQGPRLRGAVQGQERRLHPGQRRCPGHHGRGSRKAPIADRTKENLGASDNGIALYRRVLRREIKKVEEGIDPMFTFRDPAQNFAHRPAERARQAPQRRGHAELDDAHPRRPFADHRRSVPDLRGAKPAPKPLRAGRLALRS